MRGKVDMVDLAAMPLFILGSLADNGLLGSFEISGWSPTDTVLSLGPETQVTWATLLSLAALGVVIYTNKPQLDPWGGAQAWVVIATALLVIAPPFVPILDQWITSAEIMGVAAFVIQSAGYTVASFMG